MYQEASYDKGVFFPALQWCCSVSRKLYGLKNFIRNENSFFDYLMIFFTNISYFDS